MSSINPDVTEGEIYKVVKETIYTWGSHDEEGYKILNGNNIIHIIDDERDECSFIEGDEDNVTFEVVELVHELIYKLRELQNQYKVDIDLVKKFI
ncbi:hypothetical protein [Paenibacillus pini]|uniref:hypothetical protein n=1 Tax=Paenibacillus pini TaxID=669461 RepID=UPI0011DDF82E|nr:hypothetical protein [Paenibacillus pini]